MLSILASPPATAGLAWFAISDGRVEDAQVAIAGIPLSMLLVQVFLVPGYLALPFTAQHCVFTFPLAVLGNIAVRWANGVEGGGWAAAAWVVLAVTTALILAISREHLPRPGPLARASYVDLSDDLNDYSTRYARTLCSRHLRCEQVALLG